jgi:F-box and leucine-rich repeat protein GRR1
MAPSFIRRSPSPARSTSDDDEEEEEDFDVDQSHFYVDDNTIDQPQPQSPAQAQFQWINQLHRLSLSSPNGSGLYGCSDIPPHSPANTLPHEILIHVFKHVHSNRDLHSALLVSRAWCQCSVELLWHKPSFSGLASLFKLLHIITRKDQIFSYATFIRRLNFANQALDLNDQLFQRLSSCIRLERLTLVGCSLLTDTALIKVFTACPNLVALDLTHVTEVTDKSVIALATSARKLQGINLGYCKKVTDEGIFALAHLCPLLRRVKLHGLTSLTNDSISALAKRCPLLLEIDLNLCNRVTDTAVRDLWKHCYHLRELRLSHVSELSDDAFPVPPPAPKTNGNGVNPFPPQAEIRTISPLLLSRPFDHLRLLDLTSCAHLTDEAIEGIISNTPKIRHLTLAKCTSLTDDAVISVSKLGRYLHYLHLGHVVS